MYDKKFWLGCWYKTPDSDIHCNGTMVDLLKIYSNKYNFNFSYIFKSEDSLNSYNGTDLIINPFSYKLSRYQLFDFGFPFLSSPEHIYTLKPEIKVRFQERKTKNLFFTLGWFP